MRREVRSLSRHFGDIVPYRILLDPWPGAATERHLFDKIDRDNRRVELIDRTLVEKPIGDRIDNFAFAIAYWLDHHATSRGRGIVFGSRERPRVSREDPDVYFVERRRSRREKLTSAFAKTITVDFADSEDDEANRKKNRRRRFAIGTRLVWEFRVDRQTVAVYTSPKTPDMVLDAAATLAGGDVLPGFTLALAPFWAQFDD